MLNTYVPWENGNGVDELCGQLDKLHEIKTFKFALYAASYAVEFVIIMLVWNKVNFYCSL